MHHAQFMPRGLACSFLWTQTNEQNIVIFQCASWVGTYMSEFCTSSRKMQAGKVGGVLCSVQDNWPGPAAFQTSVFNHKRMKVRKQPMAMLPQLRVLNGDIITVLLIFSCWIQWMSWKRCFPALLHILVGQCLTLSPGMSLSRVSRSVCLVREYEEYSA